MSVELIAAVHTPMREDTSLHCERVVAQAEFLRRRRVSGVLVCGTTGEGPLLTTDERKVLLEAWMDARSIGEPVLVNVGHSSLMEARILARHAASCAVDGICMHAPTFFKPHGTDALIDCCATVAAEAPETPFYYYHLPRMTGVRVRMTSLLLRARDAVPTLHGIKYSDSIMSEFEACLKLRGGRFKMYFGSDELMFGAIALGCTRAIGATYNFAASHYRDLAAAIQAGELNRARELATTVTGLCQALAESGDVPSSKAIMQSFGLDLGPPRRPLRPLTVGDIRRLEMQLDSLGLL